MAREYSPAYLSNMRHYLKVAYLQLQLATTEVEQLRIKARIAELKEKLGVFSEATPMQHFRQSLKQEQSQLDEMERLITAQMDEKFLKKAEDKRKEE